MPENEGSHIRDTNMTGCMPALHSISDVKDEGHEFQKVLPIRKLEDPLPAARNRCLLLLLAFVTSIGLNVWPGDVRSTRPKKKATPKYCLAARTSSHPKLCPSSGWTIPRIRNYVHHLDGPNTLWNLRFNLNSTLHESRNFT